MSKRLDAGGSRTGRTWVAPLAVLAAGLAATAGMALHQHRSDVALDRERALGRTNLLADAVVERLVLYSYGLRGARGAVHAVGPEAMDPATFRRYARTRSLAQEFPGARGFGYIERMSHDAPLHGASYRALGPAWSERFVIRIIEPLKPNQAAVGLDIATERHRRTAALAAASAGQPRLTAPIRLVQGDGKLGPGLLFLMPVYVTPNTPPTEAGRRQQLAGFTYAPLVVADVLRALPALRQASSLRIVDTEAPARDQLLYQHGGELPESATSVERPLFGRRWRISMAPAVDPLMAPANRAMDILWVGVPVSVLLAFLAVVVAAVRRRRVDVARMQAHLAAVVDTAADAIVAVDREGRVTGWNAAASRIFGYSADEALGRSVAQLIVPPELESDERDLRARIFAGESVHPFETERICRNGSRIWVTVAAAPLRASDGLIRGYSKTLRDVTEQRQARLQLADFASQLERSVAERTADLLQAQRDLRTVLDALPSMVGYWDRHLVNRVANAAYHRWFGLPPGSMPGKAMSEIFGPQLRSMTEQQVQGALQGVPQHFERSVPRNDGTGVAHMFAQYLPDVGDDGEVRGFYVFVHDFTDVVEARKRLARVNQLLDSVLRAASEVSIIATDDAGLITVFNTGAERMLGYDTASMVGLHTPALIHDQSEMAARARELEAELGRPVSGFEVFVAKTLRDGSETREWTYVSKSGARIPVSLTVTAQRDEAGALVGYLGIATDISVQRAQRRELESARDHLLLAAEVAELGIWTIELPSYEVFWNPRMYTIYGREPTHEPVAFDLWVGMLHPDDVGPVMQAFDALLQSDEPFEKTFRILLADGSERFIQTAADVERDRAGAPRRVTGINRDVTAQYGYEREMRVARDEAEAANKAKSMFLANMSHEIRTPLNAVLGMLELTSRGKLEPRQRDYVQKAAMAARSLLALLNDLLDFSKIEAGQLQLDVRTFDLEEVLRELAAIIGPGREIAAVEPVFELSPGVPREVVGDRLRLQQILVNLVGNALKFTPAGHVVVRVASLERQGDRQLMRFEVSDTGIGISSEQLGRLFQPFVQADSSTGRRFGGSGLGLVISRRLAEMMGGELNVESMPDVGSRFWLDVPLGRVGARTLVQPEVAGAPPQVLVVDDNPIALTAMAESCRMLGWRVDSAATGEDGLACVAGHLARGERFDAVLLDWRLPDLEGGMFLDRLREASERAGMAPPRVVVVTAHDDAVHDTDATAPSLVGASLIKPVTPLQIADAVFDALGLSARPAAQDAAETQGRLPGVRMLVVEDNALNREVATELLRAEGALVDVAVDGSEGLQKVQQARPAYDVVLMDVQMPGMDGLEATRRIRADPAIASQRIVAMTANAGVVDRDACLAAGMDAFLPKPIDIGQVCQVVRQVIGAPVEALPSTDLAPLDPDAEPLAQVLLRFGNNARLLAMALASFEEDAPAMLSQLRELLIDGRLRDAESALHALKGAAGTIGVRTVSHRARQLEQEVAQHQADAWAVASVDAIVAELQAATTHAIQAMRSELVARNEDVPALLPAAGAAEPVDAVAVLGTLLPWLEQGNLAALEPAAALATHPEPEVRGIAEKVARLAFDQALADARAYLGRAGA